MSMSSWESAGGTVIRKEPRLRMRPSARLRLSVATAAGRLAAVASRLTGRGSGASIRGQVMLWLDRDALRKLLANKRIAMVSGTNGKTTTTHFLAAAMRTSLGHSADRLVHNADGANLHAGIASALSERPNADIALLEPDERVVAALIKLGRPQVLWVDTATTWTQDASLCPQCGATLARQQPAHAPFTDGWPSASRTGWYCTGCDLAQPKGDYVVEDGKIIDQNAQLWHPGLNVPGAFNISNAACALAAAELMGVDPGTALVGMRRVASPAGRFATATISGSTARLLLAKNPAGWAEALPLARTSTVILAIDSAAADGRDVSWLWDVEYEQLADRTVVATGPRAQDLAVRLEYAEVDYRCIPDLGDALADHPEPVDVIATYTPFQRLRKMGGV